MIEKKLLSFAETKFVAGDDGEMTFSGYGAVYKNTDSDGDIIEKGAFAKSLLTDDSPLMFLNHDMFRGLPIGKWTSVTEDDHGLKVKGHFLDTALGRDVHTAVKAGAIKGLSVGFIPQEVQKGRGPRVIKQGKLLEISVVTFPANRSAFITDVKSLKDQDDFVRALITLGMDEDEAKSFLIAHADNCEAKYISKAAMNVAALNLLSKLQGEK